MRFIIITCVAVITSFTASAQKAEIFQKNGYAIKGYDAVAFFKEQKPVQGSEQLTYEWKNAKWSFSTRENLDSFIATPEKYAPQYGGYCAYGTADGHKAPTQVETWTIINGKLYFNYNDKVKQMWLPNAPQLIEKADKNWPVIKDGN